jgi:hypothetical protein
LSLSTARNQHAALGIAQRRRVSEVERLDGQPECIAGLGIGTCGTFIIGLFGSSR